VGAFVLASLLVFTGLVYMLGRSAGLFERQYRLVASFGQIGGLIQGATVRLAGVPVGRVGAIRLPEPGSAKVRVELLIARRVQDRIRADSLARIETLGLLGDKIIDVTLGSQGSTILQDGGELRTEEPFDTARLTQQGAALLGNLVELSTELRTALSGITASSTGADVAETVRALRSLATEIERGHGVLHRLVYDQKLGTALADAGETLRQLGETVRRIDRVLADPRTAGLAGEAERTLAEARGAAERVNRILREVEEGKGTLHALIYDEGRMLKDLEGVLARAGTLVAGVERGEGAIGVLLRDPDAARAIRRVVTAADGLAQAVDRARTQDSVLRALLEDPALAADLRDTARSFREVTGRIARGEGMLGALTQPGRGGEHQAGHRRARPAWKAGRRSQRERQPRRDAGRSPSGHGGPAGHHGANRGGRGHAGRADPGPDGLRESGRVSGGGPTEPAAPRPDPGRDRPRRHPGGDFARPGHRDPAAMRPVSVYRCQACGFQAGKWYGRCPDCGEFNTIVEERTGIPRGSGGGRRASSTRGAAPLTAPVPLAAVSAEGAARIHSGVAELDRVLGGGVVPGSLVLIGGDPGIGKSTLLLQASAALAGTAGPVLYVSGEESASQVKLRAERLGLAASELLILAETHLETIEAHVAATAPRALIVDSIQTVYLGDLESAPGSVSQVRECGGRLMRLAKYQGIAVFLVGHVTKEGALAGPRVLEHLVDTVLYFEGERHATYRVLRAVKNRFGSTNEIGVFEMTDGGLREVANPSAMFLAERPRGAAGSVIMATLEGTRPLLLELQALVTPAHFGTPRRTVLGADYNRVCLLLAILEKRAGIPLQNQDVFVNVAGGARCQEPAADLAIAVASASSYGERPLAPDVVVLGEVGLTGEVRAIGGLETRLREAAALGFAQAVVPRSSLVAGARYPLTATGVTTLEEALGLLVG
jgi:DNA repair protein RadA/Sms